MGTPKNISQESLLIPQAAVWIMVILVINYTKLSKDQNNNFWQKACPGKTRKSPRKTSLLESFLCKRLILILSLPEVDYQSILETATKGVLW